MNIRMLCLTLLVSILFGCKSKETFGLNMERVEETRSAIMEAVPEPERRQKMMAIVNSYETESGKLITDAKKLRQQVVEVNRSYETSRADLEKLYAQLGEKLQELGAVARDHSIEFRTLCSEAEWNRIFSHDDEVVNFGY